MMTSNELTLLTNLASHFFSDSSFVFPEKRTVRSKVQDSCKKIQQVVLLLVPPFQRIKLDRKGQQLK